jgi:site-specific DNA-methyltransferase (adenine-specific)
MTHTLHLGDCRTVLATLDDASIDAIVCDPPYELGFMGKAWDNSGIAYDVTVWRQCLRVLKPGGHLVAFGGSRTYHRLAVAIEDAGFEIRDQIQWIYAQGFPKSLDVSKAMDKVTGKQGTGFVIAGHDGRNADMKQDLSFRSDYGYKYAPATDLAKQWQGWGTALKPAHEPAVLARKPLCGTVADNVTAWGVGALNIDGTRVGTHQTTTTIKDLSEAHGNQFGKQGIQYPKMGEKLNPPGRWPANVIFDEEAAQILDEQSGERKSPKPNAAIPYGQGDHYETNYIYRKGLQRNIQGVAPYGDSGGASRFFYTAKASKAEREAGLYYEDWQSAGVAGWNSESMEYRIVNGVPTNPKAPPSQRANHHPTVKPLALMRYLVRLVTPKGGKVLDPFMGSGSTGCAAVLEGFDFVGIDITPEYVAIAQKRIAHYAVETPLEGI